MDKYTFLDSGYGMKLEQFGPYIIKRPCAQAVWRPSLDSRLWGKAHASFARDGGNHWSFQETLPNSWTAEIEGIKFKISPTDFGHLGIFPEHSTQWKWMQAQVKSRKEPPNILNLFAYSGGVTMALAKAGAKVCHLDASKKSVAWARENAELNQLQKAPIRWIIDDVTEFLKREVRRGNQYDGVVLDPPSFGRGSNGQLFKIEKDLEEILALCIQVLSDQPLFILFTSHTPGFTPIVMHHLLHQHTHKLNGEIETGELLLENPDCYALPCGTYARWRAQ